MELSLPVLVMILGVVSDEGEVHTASTTLGLGLGVVVEVVSEVEGGGKDVVGRAWSTSHRAQQIVLRTHSGGPAVPVVPVVVALGVEVSAEKGISSQSTNASSR